MSNLGPAAQCPPSNVFASTSTSTPAGSSSMTPNRNASHDDLSQGVSVAAALTTTEQMKMLRRERKEREAAARFELDVHRCARSQTTWRVNTLQSHDLMARYFRNFIQHLIPDKWETFYTPGGPLECDPLTDGEGWIRRALEGVVQLVHW